MEKIDIGFVSGIF